MFCSVAVSRFLGGYDFINLSATYATTAVAINPPEQKSLAGILWQRWIQTELHLGIMARGISQIVLNHQPKLRIPLLSTVLPDEDTEALRLAHVAVRALMGQGAEHLTGIVHEFRTRRAERSRIITRNITSLGDNVIPALEEEITLHKNDKTLCAHNIEALEIIGSRNAWAALQSLINSTDGDVAFVVASYFIRDEPENENHSAPVGFHQKVREIYYRDFYCQLLSNLETEAAITPEILNAFVRPQVDETLARTQIDTLIQVARCELVPLAVRVRALELLFESSYFEHPMLFATTHTEPVIRLGCLSWLSNNTASSDALRANMQMIIAQEEIGTRNRAVIDMAEAIRLGYSFTYNQAISEAKPRARRRDD